MIGKLFVYENVRVEDNRKTVHFDYRVDTNEQTFSLTETLIFPEAFPASSTVDRLLRALHLALGMSYYKTFLAPSIDHAYFMDSDEAGFWNQVFKKGLGEFLHINNLRSEQLAKFESQKGLLKPGSQDDITWNNTALLGIGGGKDSIVAGELLREINMQTTGFVLATSENEGQARAVAEKMSLDLLSIQRNIDPQILEMNKLDGTYNGHVPVSLMFALAGCLAATVNGNRYVLVANEASASIPQVTKGTNKINHQWSKSLDFERIFQAYVHAHVSPELHYASVIRPLTSIAVAKLFAKHPAYFEVFSSDNSHFKIDKRQDTPRWSENSPKSLSSYILLAPWMNDEDLSRTFGKNFLELDSQKNLFLSLLGVQGEPVLDCVGTPSELRLSISMLADQNRMSNTTLMVLAKDKKIVLENFEHPLQTALSLSDNHVIPENLAEKLQSAMKEGLE